jgi:hypothetical protein
VRPSLPNANAPGCEKHDTLNHLLSLDYAEPLIVLSHPSSTLGRAVSAPNVVCSVVACAVNGKWNLLWNVAIGRRLQKLEQSLTRKEENRDDWDSLSLQDASGKLLVHCHAGCEQAVVVAALKARGLWLERKDAPRIIIANYDDCDENGELLYQVVRTNPKGFFQRRPDGFGGWINKKHKRQVLYHPREVNEAPIVFVVEGEKDAETLREQGFVATTNAGGANAPWLPDYTNALNGREVIIVPDNDESGWRPARTIARALLGTAARIRVLDLPDSTKDITDWFAAGHSECELIAMWEGTHAI